MKLKLKFLPRKPNGKTAEKVIGIKIHHLRYSIFPHFSNEVSLMGDTSREDPPLLPSPPSSPLPPEEHQSRSGGHLRQRGVGWVVTGVAISIGAAMLTLEILKNHVFC